MMFSPLLPQHIARFASSSRDELKRVLRIRLETGQEVELRDEYVEQIYRMLAPGRGTFDARWLRCDGGGFHFLTMADARLDILCVDPPPPLAASTTDDVAPRLHLVVDQSGSMVHINDSVFRGAKEVVEGEPTQSRVTVTTFNATVCVGTTVSRDEALRQLSSSRVASGTTSLRDAIVNVVRFEEQAAASDTTIVVLTDGMDTSSSSTVDDVRSAVGRCHDRGWRLLFLGSNQDAVLAAGNFGIPVGRALTFANDRAVNAFRAVSSNIESYRSAGQDAFTALQRQESMA